MEKLADLLIEQETLEVRFLSAHPAHGLFVKVAAVTTAVTAVTGRLARVLAASARAAACTRTDGARGGTWGAGDIYIKEVLCVSVST